MLISTDTSIVHVASTMNIKTWLLLDYSGDWRWHIQSEKFNWYDSLEIFRQKNINSWADVIDQIISKIKKWVGVLKK